MVLGRLKSTPKDFIKVTKTTGIPNTIIYNKAVEYVIVLIKRDLFSFSSSIYFELAISIVIKIIVALIHIGPHLRYKKILYKSGFYLILFKKSGSNELNEVKILLNTSLPVTLK